jgi:hypothetical protein
MSDGGIITKAALARELKISKARVSQFISLGLPVRDDGKIDRDVALSWVTQCIRRPNRADRVNSGAAVAATKALKLNDAATRDAVPELGDDRFGCVNNFSLVANSSFEIAAVLVARGVPNARSIADEIAAAIVKSVARYCDDLVDDEELPAPISAASWGDHSWFRTMPTSDTEWEEVESEATHRAKR